MAFTLQTLVGTNVDQVAVAADAWLRMANDLDDACEELIRGGRDLPHAWPMGTAADAANKANQDLRAEASNAEPPCRRIGEAMRTHADTVRSLQNLVRQIAAEATGKGYIVDLTAGTVAAGATLLQDLDQRQYLAQVITSYIDQFQSILDQAVQLDQSTINTINASVPDAQAGFGTSAAVAVSETTLQAQKGRSAADVRKWWEGLSPEQQEQAIAYYPALVGSLNGVQVVDRDRANRLVLQAENATMTARAKAIDDRIAYLKSMKEQGRLNEVYPTGGVNKIPLYDQEWNRLAVEKAAMGPKLKGMHDLQGRLDRADPPAFLMGYSSEADGRAIVAINNPDQATNVLTYVPGTTSDLPTIKADLDRADIMSDDAKLYGPAGTTTSTVLWLDYDAPDNAVMNSPSSSYADAGAPVLRDFEKGLHVTHDGPPSYNTVLGHSYGTTVVGYAAKESLETNNLVFVASPGTGVSSASHFHIQGDASNVYGTTASKDVIHAAGVSPVMRFGVDPNSSVFGGRTFDSGSGYIDPLRTHTDAYWDPHEPARKNIALIVTGQGNKIT